MYMARKITELARVSPQHYKEGLRHILYQFHRSRIRHATPQIDTKAPTIRSDAIFNMNNYRRDLFALQYQVRRNTDMMINMCGVQRMRGFNGQCAQSENLIPHATNAKLRSSEAERLQQRNYNLGQRLTSAKSSLKNKPQTYQSLNIKKNVCNDEFEYPSAVLSKYKGLQLPRDPNMLRRLLRPKIFLSFEVKDVLLGRMTIQLYTEACPEAVLAFVRTCKMQEKNKINMLRIFPSLWLEGELELDEKSMRRPKIEYDMRALDHGHNGGILSFSMEGLNIIDDEHRTLNFALSFKPLNVLNGKRVAFGQVRSGHKVLESLQDYGTKNGKLRQEVVVSELGIVF